MIDLKPLREQTKKLKTLILKKEPSFNVDKLLILDSKVKSIQSEIENLRKEKNELAKQGAKSITPEIRDKSIEIGKNLKSKEKEFIDIEIKLKNLWLSCPNIPQDDIPEGNKESNKVVKTVGEKPIFDFTPKNHVELNDKLHWFDLELAATMSGSHFVFYKENATKLIYALTQLMLKNNAQNGFRPMLPPYLVKEEALVNSGNLPKFEGDFYKTKDGLCLIPTAEVNLTNIHANQIVSAKDLPLRYCSWTSCFRKEAGGYGANDRGLIRIHQFEKVEIYSLCKPEKSNTELDSMVNCAENLLNQLGLHYRISLLAAQDCSFASSKTFDIEIWLPGQNQFYEVSSCSNCTDFQARRAKIRYRNDADSKPELVHTLNASSIALPRLIVALMETYQKEDGSIELPTMLTDAMNNLW